MPFDLFCANFCHGTIDVVKAPLPRRGWELYSEQHTFDQSQWWNQQVVLLSTGEQPTWTYFSVCQATKRGNTDTAFVHIDTALLVAEVQANADGRLGQITHIKKLNLPGQCKTDHFELFLDPCSCYAVFAFSISRTDNNVATRPAHFTLRIMSAKPLGHRHRRVERPDLLVTCIHQLFASLLSNRSNLNGFRVIRATQSLPDCAGNVAQIVAVESTGGILLAAFNPSPTHFAAVEVVVSGIMELAGVDHAASSFKNEQNPRLCPTRIIPPMSSAIVAAMAHQGFQDYQIGFNAGLNAGHLETFMIQSVTVVMQLNRGSTSKCTMMPNALIKPRLLKVDGG
jgi:hypothetical protein